ncbi:MAG: hypothetical protein WAT66_13855, partial [Actinomycetota bacterium]
DVSKDGEEESGATSSYFLAAAKDGSRAYYATGAGLGDLYEYDAATEESTFLAGGLAGYMGAAEDGLSLYFVSREALTPGQENSEGAEAEDKAANLYRYRAGEGGGPTFVAILAEDDLTGFAFAGVANLNELSPVGAPGRRSSRVTPDGNHAIFTSVGSLTGYDNADVLSPAPCGQTGGICDAELFRFDAAARGGQGEIACLSCNRSGGRPVGEELEPGFFAAGWVRGFETNLYASRNLSDDGSRVFFESSDALVSRDTNSEIDVYQWEEPGAGSCEEQASSFVASAGGCIELISSGQSAHESSFIEASASGSDVFFATLSSLYPGDPGLVDVYDARIEGGFAAPEEEGEACEGESCQSPPPAPEFQPPTSSTYSGPGNLAAPKKKKAKKHCAKGKHKVKRKGKVRCVKKKNKKKAQKRAHHRAHEGSP